MFRRRRKKVQQQQSTTTTSQTREESTRFASIVKYALYEAKIDAIPDGAVGFFIADAADLLGVMLTRGIFAVPIIVYRTGNLYKLYNHELILSGAIQIMEKNERGYLVILYGEEMKSHSGFGDSRFLNTLGYDYKKMQDQIERKFYNLRVLYYM